MKKYFLMGLVCLTCLVSLVPAFAQDDRYDPEDFADAMKKWGAKLGGNISTFGAVPPDSSLGSKFGLYLGAYSRTPLNDNFILQFELGYSALGATQKESESLTYSYPVGYLAIGAVARFFPFEDYLGLNAGVGLQYGYMISASNGDLDWLQRYNASDFEIVAGLGYELDNGLNFELRYLLGLSNIWNKETTGIYQIWKNRAFQLQIGWTF